MSKVIAELDLRAVKQAIYDAWLSGHDMGHKHTRQERMEAAKQYAEVSIRDILKSTPCKHNRTSTYEVGSGEPIVCLDCGEVVA